MPRVVRFLTLAIVLGSCHLGPRFAASMAYADSPAGELAFFETKIRPVLVKHCYECHAEGAEEIGGKLLLDSRDGLRRGGESGPAIVVGKPEQSLLVRALRYDRVEMPPDAPLPPTIVNDFVEWIRRGAVDPRVPKIAGTATDEAKKPSTMPTEKLWSLEPVRDPAAPAVKNVGWVRDPLDRFVLARIERAGLAPLSDADPHTLVRRLYFDLVGLPPTAEEIAAFVEVPAEEREAAYAALVDRLLASPQFGEHWGRYWLDVARYGESNGNDGLSRNPTFPHAWRYRDYVLAAFNHDVPFDRFLTEQIAGDLLPSESPAERDRLLTATGFLALASKPAKAMNANFEMDVVADQLDVIGRGVLGLSIACARCHDHKFDPIPTSDYYALAGIFAATETLWGTAANEGLTAPATDLHVLQAAPKSPPPEGFVETVLVPDSNTGKPKAIPKSKWPVGTPLAMGVRDRAKPADIPVHVKGEITKGGKPVPRGFLSAVSVAAASTKQTETAKDDDEAAAAATDADELAVDTKQSGRLQLARWLVHERNPLTARVYVNRLWQQLFGEGIVRTPDDFGVYGERPSDPALLDHLAVRFVREGWSTKRLVRALVLSRTYRSASLSAAGPESEKLLEVDPQNLLFARHNRRRLTAEQLRDAMLQTSGRLDPTPGRGSLVGHRDILVNLAGNLHEPSNHRSVYLCYLRSSPPPELAAFDLPDFTAVLGKREQSTVPSQALHLFNSPFVVAQAEYFGRRVCETSQDPVTRIDAAWQFALGRLPTNDERREAGEFVAAAETELGSADRAWAAFCQGLLVSNEFRYVD